MNLIATIAGTVRLMSKDEMYMEDIGIGIYKIFKFLNKEQREDLYNYAKTEITDTQEEKIRMFAGV